MNESLHERCLRLCGKTSQSCFINDTAQLTCLSDMLINKAYGLSSLLELIKAEGLPESSVEMVDESVGITQEIINWVKYLQVTRDLSHTIRCAMDGKHPVKRSEMRFPFPDALDKQIILKARCDSESHNVRLVNFSKSGLQFVCNGMLETGRSFDAELVAVLPDKTLGFKAVVKYIMEHDSTFIVGAAIEEVSNNTDFDFFRGVLEFISATIAKVEKDENKPV